LRDTSSPLDAFCAKLQQELVYNEDERDMVIMHHEFGFNNANGEKVNEIFFPVFSQF